VAGCLLAAPHRLLPVAEAAGVSVPRTRPHPVASVVQFGGQRRVLLEVVPELLVVVRACLALTMQIGTRTDFLLWEQAAVVVVVVLRLAAMAGMVETADAPVVALGAVELLLTAQTAAQAETVVMVTSGF